MAKPQDGELRVRSIASRYGRIAVPDDADDLIGKFIAHYGEWAYLEAEFLAQYLPRSARTLDIGAFIGTFSMGLALAADVAYCCMVEGNPALTPLLRTNAAAILKCPNDVLDALVVDPHAPPVNEGWAAANNAGSTSFAPDAVGATSVAATGNTVTLAQLVDGVTFDLVKLDVEGMEHALLASCATLLADRNCLIWVECNENPRSRALAELLLRTGRPLTYFAWPSHKPRNHCATTVPIFPFACEAGLLLGASPKPLARQLEEAGCLMREILTLDDLKSALWHTPRWAPDNWVDLSRSQLVSIASHLQLGQRWESFLEPNAADEAAIATESSAAHAVQFANFKNERLRETLAATTDLLFDARISLKRAVDQIGTQQQEIQRAGVQVALAATQAMELQARHLQELRVLREEHLAVSSALRSVQGSLTWRIGRRLSLAAGRIPLLKRSIRLVIGR